MPSFGLMCTSIAFFIPAWIAKRREQKGNASLISTLATSSILYHGTLHPYMHMFDIVVAHSIAVHYLLYGIRNVLKYRKKFDIIGMLFGTMSTHMYYRKSLPIKDDNISRKWHMRVHISAQIALIAFIMGSHPPIKPAVLL